MNHETIENKNFDNIDYTGKAFVKAEYDSCTFNGCNFSHLDLSGFSFMDCTFENCNLSMAKMNNSSFKEVQFIKCKMLGVNFRDCKNLLLSMDFEDCHLDHSSFYKLELKNIKFRNCNLHEVDFAKTDLSSALFANCDLGKAIFENTILQNADFKTAYNYTIDPALNRIRGAKFSRSTIDGLLAKYDIEIE